MKKLIALLLLFLILFSSACAADGTQSTVNGNDDYIENHFVFKGESESWSGEMKVDSTLQFYEKDGVLGCDTNEKHKLTVTYKGDVSDLSSVKQLKIDFDAGPSSGSLEEEHVDDPITQKTFVMQGGGSGTALIQKDKIVTVTVTIDGKTESFEMKNQG